MLTFQWKWRRWAWRGKDQLRPRELWTTRVVKGHPEYEPWRRILFGLYRMRYYQASWGADVPASAFSDLFPMQGSKQWVIAQLCLVVRNVEISQQERRCHFYVRGGRDEEIARTLHEIMPVGIAWSLSRRKWGLGPWREVTISQCQSSTGPSA